MKKLLNTRTLRLWLPMAIIATGLAGTIYLTAQQQLRLGANEELVRTATDISLSPGLTFTDQAQFSDKTDVRHSLSTAVILMDEQKKVISSQASLDGSNISPPVGTLDYARTHDDHRFTWEPTKGVRLATVVKYKAGGGYIIIVRNLREVEALMQSIMLDSLLGLVATLFASLAVISVFEKRPETKE